MNDSRRRFLELLAVGGAVGLSGCPLSGDDARDTASETRTSGSERGADGFDASVYVEPAIEDPPATRPGPEFSYEPVDTSVTDGSVEHVRAKPGPTGHGDALQVRPGSRSAAALASWLRVIWNVEPTERVSTTVSGTDVELRGGTAFGTAYFTGTATLDDTVTVAVRGEDVATATALAEREPFPLGEN